MIHTISDLHESPVIIIEYNHIYDVAISIDLNGMIEYWSASDYTFPTNLDFQFKTDTDLYEFAKVCSNYF